LYYYKIFIYRFKSIKVEVIFWGVDTKKIRPCIDTEPLRSELGIAANALVVLSNRSFAPLYNNDIWGMYLTQVSTTSSVVGHGGRLPKNSDRDGRPLSGMVDPAPVATLKGPALPFLASLDNLNIDPIDDDPSTTYSGHLS